MATITPFSFSGFVAQVLYRVMKVGALFGLVCTLAITLTAQPTAPDCSIPFTLTATGTSVFNDNRQNGCTNWVLTYTSTGFSAVSIALQSAPDTGGAPGAWVNWAGTVVSGSNPSTDTAQSLATFTGYYPWVRVSLTATGTGTTRGLAYGWKTAAARLGGGGGGGSPTGPAGGALSGTYPNPLIAGVVDVGGVAYVGSTPGELVTSPQITVTVDAMTGAAQLAVTDTLGASGTFGADSGDPFMELLGSTGKLVGLYSVGLFSSNGVGSDTFDINASTLTATNPDGAGDFLFAVIAGGSQAGNLQEWRANDGTAYVFINSGFGLTLTDTVGGLLNAHVDGGGVLGLNSPTSYFEFNAFGMSAFIADQTDFGPLSVNASTTTIQDPQPSTGNTKLVVQAGEGQTGNLQEWRDFAGTTIGAFNPFDTVSGSVALVLTNVDNATRLYSFSNGSGGGESGFISSSPDFVTPQNFTVYGQQLGFGTLDFEVFFTVGADTTNTNVTILAGGAQSENMLELQNSAGTPITFFDATGDLSIVGQAAATGVRYLCIDTAGKIASQAAACVGT